MFATAIHLHPSLIIAGKARDLPLQWSPVGAPLWYVSALPANIRLGEMAMANTPAYYDIATITAVKSFIVQALGLSVCCADPPEIS